MKLYEDDLVYILLMLLTSIGCVCIGNSAATVRFRNEAVKAGVAEWRSDESGKPAFTWKHEASDE